MTEAMNFRFVPVLAGIGLALALAGCQPAGAALEAVRSASAAWDQAHNAADLGRLSPLYDNAAVSMPYHRPALEGRAAIEADFRELFSAFNATHKTTIVGLEISGDWAIERGKYELSMTPKSGGPTVKELGKHIVVRRKVDGAWKVHWEIWNTDAAPPAP